MELAQQEHGPTATSNARETWLRRHSISLGLGFVVFLGGFLRFFLIGDKTIWLDEALTIAPARLSLAEGWHWLVFVDAHPPLYYLLLHLWLRLFGDGPAAARSLSAVCSTLTLPVFYVVARRLLYVASEVGEFRVRGFGGREPPASQRRPNPLRAPRMDRRAALLATFILAISCFHVRFGQEVRMYAFITLLVCVNLYFLSRLLFDEKPRRWPWWGLALSEAAVMLTHNTALLYPLALNVGMLAVVALQVVRRATVSRSTEPSAPFVGRWIVFQALALLLWSPWILALVRQSSMLYQRHWIPFPTAHVIWRAIENFSFSSIPKGFPYLSGWISLYLLLAVAGAIWLRHQRAAVALLLSLLSAPIVAELLVSLKRPMFLDRTLIWATLAYYGLVAAGICAVGVWLRPSAALGQRRPTVERVGRLASRGVPLALVCVVIALSSFALKHYYVDYKKEEWDKAARYVARRVQRGDTILFNTILGQVPFEYYFRQFPREVEMRGLPMDLEARPLPEPTMTEADVPYAQRLLKNRRRVWLVYSHQAYTDPDRLVWRVLKSEMCQGETRGFVGLTVTLFSANDCGAAIAPR
jgi:uncharacterized membrane protein